MDVQIVTPPTNQPVTLEQVKMNLRLRATSVSEDALLEDVIIPAAHEEAATELRRTIMLTTWLGVMDAFPSDRCIVLPRPNLQSVESVQYRDEAGALQTLSTASYGVEPVKSLLYLKPDACWPTTEGTPGCVRITWKAGYSADAGAVTQQAAVPARVKSWILLRCGDLFENRELIAAGATFSEIPTARGLLDGERVVGF